MIPIFPTLVWKLELEAQLLEAICAQTLAALARLRRDLPPLAPGQGWQSVQSLHVVFPAYLQHSVDASTSEEERISVRFNIMFSSLENLRKPLWGGAAYAAARVRNRYDQEPTHCL